LSLETLSQLKADMASIIPGYEYDVFISYRQEDNKEDRCVSEFVAARYIDLLRKIGFKEN